MLSGVGWPAPLTRTGNGDVDWSPAGSVIRLAVVHGFGAVAACAAVAPAVLASSADTATHALRVPCMSFPPSGWLGAQTTRAHQTCVSRLRGACASGPRTRRR